MPNEYDTHLGATEQHGISAFRRTEGKLVKGDDLAAGLKDAGLSGLGHTESRKGDFGNLAQAVIVGDGADNDCDLVRTGVLDVTGDPRDGDRGTVDAGHEKALEDHLVEGRVSTAGEEPIELWDKDSELNKDQALSSSPVTLPCNPPQRPPLCTDPNVLPISPATSTSNSSSVRKYFIRSHFLNPTPNTNNQNKNTPSPTTGGRHPGT
ncbi:hypothetical protein BC936DRAFT_144124 [Jimgerdemannia flammicorona]|uniref:Uncharacterized protein n=1 Tax=Jimgerdemannia flammicorona TaxID=994334 RepID=A0A433DD15_9FUNG|nr:hypothetical protein BC936DRAFT_144124 [Jimgerdemannia flammicorona]